MTAITVEVPFERFGNRQVLTRHILEECPWVVEFILQFPKCFEHDPFRCLWVFWPEGDSPFPVDDNMFRRTIVSKRVTQ